LFPQKFKTGTAAIVPAGTGQSEPEKSAEPGTFRQFVHPTKTEIGGPLARLTTGDLKLNGNNLSCS